MKHKLNEEFIRMKKLAGLLTENEMLVNPTHKSLVDWYYIEDKGRVMPDVKGYDLTIYPNKELYIEKGIEGWVFGNKFEDEEGNDVPFSEEYFETL